ncbi:hypothetical protein V8E36_000958 [Tilletia maclaganii]
MKRPSSSRTRSPASMVQRLAILCALAILLLSSCVCAQEPALSTITTAAPSTSRSGAFPPASTSTGSLAHAGNFNGTALLNSTIVAIASPTSAPPASVTPTIASPPPSSATPTSSPDSLPLDTKVDATFGILGVVLLLSGAATCGWGHRNRWSSFFLCGFYILSLSTLCAILSLGVEKGIKPPSPGVRGLFLLASVIAGVVGGVLFILFHTWAAFAVCGLGGFAVGLWFQALRSDGLIPHLGLRWILLAGCTAVFFALGCLPRLHSAMVLIGTATSGATAMLLGIDCFSRAGLKEFYVRNLGYQALFADKYPPTFQDGRFPLVASMQVELGVMAAVAAMGIAFQSRLYVVAKDRIEVLRDVDRDRRVRREAEKAARHVSRNAERDLAEWEVRYGSQQQQQRGTTSASATPMLGQSIDFGSMATKVDVIEHLPPAVRPSSSSLLSSSLPRLWLSHTPFRTPGRSEEADSEAGAREVEEVEKASKPVRPSYAPRRSTQNSFMSYVGGNAAAAQRDGRARADSSGQVPGLLPVIPTGGTAFRSKFELREPGAESRPTAAGDNDAMKGPTKTVVEERSEILKEIARIRASISQLERSTSDEAIASPAPAAASHPSAPALQEGSQSHHAARRAPSISFEPAEQRRTHGRARSSFTPVSESTFNWVSSTTTPAPQACDVRSWSSQNGHTLGGSNGRSQDSRRSGGDVNASSSLGRRSMGNDRILTHNRTSLPALSRHVKAMSIDELQSAHRQRMRSRQRSVNDALALQKARAEWDTRQAEERVRMSAKLAEHALHQRDGPVSAGSTSVGGENNKGGRVRARSIEWGQLGGGGGEGGSASKRSRSHSRSRI